MARWYKSVSWIDALRRTQHTHQTTDTGDTPPCNPAERDRNEPYTHTTTRIEACAAQHLRYLLEFVELGLDSWRKFVERSVVVHPASTAHTTHT